MTDMDCSLGHQEKQNSYTSNLYNTNTSKMRLCSALIEAVSTVFILGDVIKLGVVSEF